MKLDNFDEKKGKAVITIVIVAVVVVLIVMFGKNIGDWIRSIFGKDDAQSKAARDQVHANDQNPKGVGSPFALSTFNNRPDGTTDLSDDQVSSIISDVYKSVGILWWLPFGTDIDAGEAYQALEKCSSKSQVSQCAAAFADEYKTDMYDYMSKYFNSNANVEIFAQILTYCNSLPAYT